MIQSSLTAVQQQSNKCYICSPSIVQSCQDFYDFYSIKSLFPSQIYPSQVIGNDRGSRGEPKSEETFYERGKCDILCTQTSAIVGGESYLNLMERGHCSMAILETEHHLVVDVKPFRVVIHLVSFQGNPGHKAPGLVEVLEDKLLVNCISVLYHAPS